MIPLIQLIAVRLHRPDRARRADGRRRSGPLRPVSRELHRPAARDQDVRDHATSPTNPRDARTRDRRRAAPASASSSRPTTTTSARAERRRRSSCSSTAPTRPSARRRSPRSTASSPTRTSQIAREGSRAAACRSSAQPIILFNPDGRTANYIIPGLVAILLQIVAIVLAAGLDRARARAGHARAAPRDADQSARPHARQGRALPVRRPRRDGADPRRHALRLRRAHPRQPRLPVRRWRSSTSFALLALGLFISTRAKTQPEAQQMAQMLFLPSIFLSGYIFPLERPAARRCRSIGADPAGDAHDRDHARRRPARRRPARARAPRPGARRRSPSS